MKRILAPTEVGQLDLILNTLLCITVLFYLAYRQMNPEAQQLAAALKTDGKYAAVLDWPDGSNDDVDLYVMNPTGDIVYFKSREVGLMHLEHDDLGGRSDSVKTAKGDVRVDTNEERVIIRGVIPGEYVVNVHMYHKADPKPTPVTITLFRLAGDDAEIVKKERTLERDGDEKTAFRFTLADDLSVSGINELPRDFVGKAAGPSTGQMRPGGWR